MSQVPEFEKVIYRAFDVLSEALEAVDAAENQGAKVHPSVGNRLHTAKLILTEVMADLQKSPAQELRVPSTEPVNTKISYQYRDASNYKVRNECVIPGVLTKEQKATILDCLEDSENFIPSAVGLPETTFVDLGYSYSEEDDHPWFELYEDGFETTTAPATVEITTEELVAAFCERKGNWLASETTPEPNFLAEVSVREWYCSAFPSDSLGPEIRSGVSFADLYDAITAGKSVYEVLGVWDSIVRERTFSQLASLKGVTYDVIHDMYTKDRKEPLKDLIKVALSREPQFPTSNSHVNNGPER